MSVLFVLDDDTMFQRLIKLTLIKYPVFKHVLYYNESIQLVNYLAEYKDDFSNLPDVILLDLNMAGKDGWTVLDVLQKSYTSLCKKIEVYIVTVSIIEEDRRRALNYQFVKEFITKPLYKDKLIAIADDVKNEHR